MPLASSDETTSQLVEHLSSIVGNAQDAIWSVDSERRFVTFNPFMRDRVLAWWNIELSCGMRHGGRSGPEAEFWNGAYDRVLRGEFVTVHREYLQGGIRSVVEFTLHPIRDSHGRITGAAGIGRDVTHIFELDREIREREAAWRQLLDSTSDAIWSVDTQYRFVTFNRFLHDIMQAALGKDIHVGMNHVETETPEQAAFWKAAYDRALHGESFTIEQEYRNPAGHAFVEFALRPIYEAKQIIGVAGVGRDVTRLRNISQALEHSVAAYRLLFEDSPLPMWTVDFETLHFTQFNRAALKLYGYTAEEFRQLTLLDIRPAEHRKRFAEGLLAEMQRDRSDRHNFSRHLRKDGTVIEVEVFSHPLVIDGHYSRLALVKDITGQRNAETELVRSNERFRLASEAITSVVWEWDRTGYIQAFGPLERLLGFPVGEAAKVPSAFWKERIPREDRWRIGRQFIAATQTQSRFEAEFRLRHKDGRYVYTWTTAAILRNEAGKAIRIVGSTLDVTERKQMEMEIRHERQVAILEKERAEEMSRLKSSFLANMSHEIRTPLTAILGFAELLQEDLPDPEKKSQAGMIQSSGKRLLETINQILDLARIEAGKVELNPSELLVSETLEECVGMLRPLAEKKGLRVTIEEVNSNVRLWADKLYFNQIFTNLIGNAIKFTEHGRIKVQIKRHEIPVPDPAGSIRIGHVSFPCVAIEVRDEGIGISKEFLPHIFDEFKQESAGYSRNYEGTGIGLTITAKLVLLMRGAITVSSEIGQGSRFRVMLPLKDREA